MSRVLRTTVRHAGFASALAGLTVFSIGAAIAGDLGPPVYGPAGPYGAPLYDAPQGGPCRIMLERRIDPYGREIVHRIRMCDDGPVYPGDAAAPPEYAYPPPRYYAPSPSGYDPYPRPPAPIPGYY